MPTHAEKKILPYTPAQMYALVADVERYPEFLPWCLDCRIKSKQRNVIMADLTVGYKIVRETFTSEVKLNERSRKIDVRYIKGPFKYLNNHWEFHPVSKGMCEVDFYIDFEFGSGLLQAMMGVFFNEAVRRMISAFEARAHDLYGK